MAGLDNVFYKKSHYFIGWFDVVSLGTPLDDPAKKPEVRNPEALLQEIEEKMSLPGKNGIEILQYID